MTLLKFSNEERFSRLAIFKAGQDLYREGKPLPPKMNLLFQNGYYSMVGKKS